MSPHLLLSRPVSSGCVAPARLTRLGQGRLEIQGEPSVYFSAAGSQRDLACSPASDYLGVLSSGCPLDLGGELGGLGVEAEPPPMPTCSPGQAGRCQAAAWPGQGVWPPLGRPELKVWAWTGSLAAVALLRFVTLLPAVVPAGEGRSRGWGGLLPALVSLCCALGCLRSDSRAEA